MPKRHATSSNLCSLASSVGIDPLRRRRIEARIVRRGVESSKRLGRHRWAVERTLAWFSRFRRSTVRYERRADIHQAFLSLAASLICWSYVQRPAH